jgi:hypothetical protein
MIIDRGEAAAPQTSWTGLRLTPGAIGGPSEYGRSGGVDHAIPIDVDGEIAGPHWLVCDAWRGQMTVAPLSGRLSTYHGSFCRLHLQKYVCDADRRRWTCPERKFLDRSRRATPRTDPRQCRRQILQRPLPKPGLPDGPHAAPESASRSGRDPAGGALGFLPHSAPAGRTAETLGRTDSSQGLAEHGLPPARAHTSARKSRAGPRCHERR